MNEQQTLVNFTSIFGGGADDIQREINISALERIEKRVVLRFESVDMTDDSARMARRRAYVILAKLKHAITSTSSNEKNYSLISSDRVLCDRWAAFGIFLQECKGQNSDVDDFGRV